MNATNTLRDLIKKHEGTKKKNGRHILYKCSANKWTCGWGRNCDDKGFSRDEVELMLTNDIQEAGEGAISIFPDLYKYTTNRQNALIDMCFNLGKSRLLRFKKMIAAVKEGDWKEAAAQARDSAWHTQVGLRATEIEKMLEEG